MLVLCGTAMGQLLTVTAHVQAEGSKRRAGQKDRNRVVVWLTPVGTAAQRAGARGPHGQPLRLTQHNKSFDPHLLVVPVGSVVEFPNRDPFFHNVFSLFEGKRFDLGLYEAGTTREVRFDKPGVSYIFCNIHAEMSAVVIALATPYYGISTQRGEISIPDVPPGTYRLQTWYEAALPETLDSSGGREIQLTADSANLGTIRVPAASTVMAHKNKYGRDYDPPAPDNPAYPQH
jgi:plastocyanin